MVELRPLLEEEREEFIRRNQAAFLEALAEEMPEGEEVISREEVLESLLTPKAQAFQVYWKNDLVGGVVVQIDTETKRNSLDLLFVDGSHKGKGLGLTIWQAIEQAYPDTEVWETHTPYFEVRNIHFYVNKCGFQIVEFFNPAHPMEHVLDFPDAELFFRFEKRMK
ncbi:TPA: GNAT family N-acetyltransferase [Streptococcus suis]|nr:GNAT family N-acetyltransferase [Streptococcus suis]HEM5110799.1 GNAT family N-acetyltransferase [Streptococcus suis]